ncbi:MAG: contractile injection system tape measure protein [Candidatus Competibacteraceae bacterium]
MTNSLHRIRRQRWLVRTPSKPDAFAIRKHLHDNWQDLLLPAFEKVFDQVAGEDRLIHIPRIVLRLRVASERQLIEELPDLIQQQLREQLQIMRSVPQPAEDPRGDWQEIDLAQSRFERLLHYLRTGSLPWQVTPLSGFEPTIELTATCLQQAPQLLDYLQHHPETAPFYFRLYQLLPATESVALTTALVQAISEPARSVVAQVSTSLLSAAHQPFSPYLRLQLAARIVAESLKSTGSDITSAILGIAEQVLPPEASDSFRDFIAALPDVTARLSSLPAGRTAQPNEAAPASAPAGERPTPLSAMQRADWQEIDLAHSRFERLLHYLRTGSLPWQVTPLSGFEPTIELTATCLQQAPQLLDYLQHHPETAPFYFRLYQLLPATESVALTTALVQAISEPARSVVAQVSTSLLNAAHELFNPHLRLQLAARIVVESLKSTGSDITSAILGIAEQVLPPEASDSFRDFIAALPDVTARLSSLSGSRATQPNEAVAPSGPTADLGTEPTAAVWLPSRPASGDNRFATVAAPVGGRQAEPEASFDRMDDSSSATNPLQARSFSAPVGKQPSAAETAFEPTSNDSTSQELFEAVRRAVAYPFRSSPPVEAEFPVAVHQAGSILLHPFIPRFFETTGVKEPGHRELSASTLARAAALLHWLATAREEVYEYELGFIKVLVGLEPETALPVAEGLITAVDKQEADALLQAVIGYWSVLKNTSVAGLRTSFLQRPGLLRADENGWRLQVEPMPFDMLLNRLSWGIGIVKLPWMQKVIYTEWTPPC